MGARVVAFLREHGHRYVERAYGAGRPQDVGDVDGLPGWCLEAKNQKAMDLAGWCDEAAREALERPPGRPWAVVAKRRNKPVSEAYVVLSLATFADLLRTDTEEV